MMIFQLGDKLLRSGKNKTLKTLNISYKVHFEIWFSNAFDTFQISHSFRSNVLGILQLKYKI